MNVVVVELIVVVVPRTVKLPLICTVPVSSPTAAGSITKVAGPVIELVVILIPVPDAPVDNWVARTVPSTWIFCSGVVIPKPTFPPLK